MIVTKKRKGKRVRRVVMQQRGYMMAPGYVYGGGYAYDGPHGQRLAVLSVPWVYEQKNGLPHRGPVFYWLTHKAKLPPRWRR